MLNESTLKKLGLASFLLPLVLSAPACMDGDPDAGQGQGDEDVAASDQAVVQGTSEPNYLYPWEVSLNGCHGTLIDPQWVLTAAHCVQPRGWSNMVYYSRTDASGQVHSGSRTVSQFSGPGGVFIHPGYVLGGGFSGPVNDIALIKLDSPFIIDQYIQTVQLPTSAPTAGLVGTIAAYSHSSVLPPGYDAIMRAAIPSVVPFGCGGTGQFCLTSPTTSLCPGDSGSGFVSVENYRAVLVGIASYAHTTDSTCKTVDPHDYAGLTDVNYYRGWVLSTLSGAGWTPDNAHVGATGRTARGVLGIGCDDPEGTMWAPTYVAGVQLGSRCVVGDTMAVVCSIDAGQVGGFQAWPVVITAFTMTTFTGNGTSTTQALPFGKTSATYYGVMPGGVTRNFNCQIGLSSPVFNGGGGGVISLAQ